MALCYKNSRTMQNMSQQVLLTASCMFVFLEFSHESCLGLMLFPLGFQWWVCDNFWGCGFACVLYIFDLINTWLFLCVSFLLLSVVCYICEFLWTFCVIKLTIDLMLGWGLASGFTAASECKDWIGQKQWQCGVNIIQHLTHSFSIFFYRFFIRFWHWGQ